MCGRPAPDTVADITLAVGPGVIWCRLPETPGGEATVTVLDPPCFGADGMLLPRSTQVPA